MTKPTDKRMSGILDELNRYIPQSGRQHFIESCVEQAVANVQNIIDMIDQNYDTEVAEDLKKRLYNSIRTGDSKKFSRGIKAAGNNNDR